MPRYLIYARKSSESEDRQALSIESQVKELTEFAKLHGLDILQVLTESRSAKTPGRPVFADLLSLLTRRAANGVLCWKLDRLARNPVDGGAIIWGVDQGTIGEIVTPGRSFSNRGDDKFWMQLEFGMAKKYVDDLSDNVRRGNRAKLERGWLPGVPPLGYLNDPGTRTIVSDPERFPVVRKIWTAVLSGVPPARVLNLALTEWNLRTRALRRGGGGPLTRSSYYKLLSNPFYAGVLIRSGESFVGAHQPMVSKDEFERVQTILGRPSRVPRNRHLFPFLGVIRCGECGCAITAEEHVNRYGYRYRYYHCTKKKRTQRCTQRAIRAEALEDQIRATLEGIAMPPGLVAWSRKHLSVLAEDERSDARHVGASLERSYGAVKKRAAELIDLRLRGLLSDDEFLGKKRELAEEELRLREELSRAKAQEAPRWLEPSLNAISFATLAAKRFREVQDDEKRAILLAVGSNLVLKDRNLRITTQQPFRDLSEGKGCGVGWSRVYAARIFQRWKVWFSEHPDLIHWPEFCRTPRNSRPPRPSSDEQ